MKMRRALGRGLDALIPGAGTGFPATPPSSVNARPPAEQDAPLDAIRPNPRQPRAQFDEAGIAELAASIREKGVLQPLLVRQIAGGEYELVAGERRLRAARLAGLSRVPIVVRMEGTNVEEGRRILRESGLTFILAEGMKDAADKAVLAAGGRS